MDAQNSSFDNHTGFQFVGTHFHGGNVNFGPVSLDKEEQEEQMLAKLPYAESATFNHCQWQGESRCLAGTRTQVLSEIMAWVRGDRGASGQQRIYWLSGMAGTGKSTIARTVARACSDEGRLGASFFFLRGGGELETARMFVTTIAVQLARFHRQLRTHIYDALRVHPDIPKRLLSDQWQHLVVGPCERLREAGALPALLVVVVDALDECKAPAEIEFVLELLSDKVAGGLAAAVAAAAATTTTTTEPLLRIFLTSRPAVTIRAGLHDMSRAQRRHVILHHVEPAIVNSDISVFFRHHMFALIPERPMLPSLSDEQVLQRLVERAGGLFIWAATAYRFVKEGGPHMRNRLDSLVTQRLSAAAASPERKLDAIYTSVLLNALREQWTDDETEQFCRKLNAVLGTIVVSFASLSAPGLAQLLSLAQHEVLDVLCDLHSVLDVPQDRDLPIRPQHASVRDFVLSQQRCTDARFWVDENLAHDRIAYQCLMLMTKTLKRDISGLKAPGVLLKEVSHELIDARVPPSLRYACLYWVRHVGQSAVAQRLHNLIDSFIRQHLLHWLEVLALIGKVSDGIEMIALLCTVIRDDVSSLSLIVADAKQFLLHNRQMIEEAPLQLYHSAIVFAPLRSLVRQTYLHALPNWLCRLPEIHDNWGEEILTLGGHSASVRAVAFSPDGSLIASASNDKTVRLWNVTTGAACGVLQGHLMNVLCVSFSPDGSRLASASRDATVRIWSVKTGRCDILEGRLHGVKHVAFAPDGLFLASAAEDGSIKLWNLTTGTPYVTSLNDWGDVWSLAFSPDSKALTSVTTDANAIRVVTATVACSTPTENERRETALLNSPISAAASAVMSSAQLRLDQSTTIDAVALSLDGRLVAFSTPSKLRLCSVTSSNVIFDVDEVTIGDWCYALTISPDSKMLACGYILGKVVLYDIESGIEYGSRGGHYSPVTTVAFSPDGQFFASGSDDGTVCIWDVAPSTTRGSLDRSTARVNYLAYLPDRQTLAAFYRRGPVEVRDVRSGSRRTLGVDCGDWKDVAISPDSRRVAVSCSDWIELAEVASGATRRICNNYGHDATLAFSPDGKLLLSGSDRGLVRLHDSSTGAALNIIGEHLEYVTSVIFSPDGRLVAAASRDETVRCWDLVTGNALRHLKGHGGSVNSIAISPTSLYLVSGSRDETVKLWYLATSAECYTFKGHSAPVHRVAISPDGQLIASASVADVRLWSAAMREQIHVYPKHSGIRSLRFSTDPCCIETDQGAVALPFGYPTGSSAYSHAVGPLCVIDQWLMCDSKRLLWLPYEYRPTAVATCGNMISLGLNSGEVISLSFDFQNGRPWDSPDTDL